MPALELLHIRKSFGQLAALEDVSLRLEPGTVHGLLGENGAGKSTLMNIAYGLLRPDSGQIRIAPHEDNSDVNIAPSTGIQSAIHNPQSAISFRSPRDAIAAGIGMVHQHFMLAPAMTVLDNILLGDRRMKQWLARRDASKKIAELADKLNLPIDPSARIESLSVGQQQRVEILKALWRDAKILILDEPTAVLTPLETDQLFAAIDRLRSAGHTIVFISHKLNEVKRICDKLTVLRRGKVVWEGDTTTVSTEEIARHMVGEEAQPTPPPKDKARDDAPLPTAIANSLQSAIHNPKSEISNPKSQISDSKSQISNPKSPIDPSTSDSPPILQLSQITSRPLHNISLSLTPGSMLGIAGVDGNGQQELAEIIVGLRRPTAGQVLLGGIDITRHSMKKRLKMGLAHIPNDRKKEALVGTMSIAENIALKSHDSPPFARAGLISWRWARSIARSLIEKFDIRAGSERTPVATLSGGNQQKVVLARELALAPPRLIVAMNPVRGLDIAATRFVYNQLLAARAAGAAILLISSELDELIELCDKIAVLYTGRLTTTDFPKAGREEIGRLMAGI